MAASSTQSQSFELNEVYFLRIEIKEGVNLIASDVGGTSDPYCVVSVGDKQFRTKVIKKNLNPKWNETTTFSFLQPVSTIRFDVFDEDKSLVGKDDKLGNVELDVASFFTPGSPGFCNMLALKDVKKGKIDIEVMGRVVKPIELEQRIAKMTELKNENETVLKKQAAKLEELKKESDNEAGTNQELVAKCKVLEKEIEELRTTRFNQEQKNNDLKGQIEAIEKAKIDLQTQIDNIKNDTEAKGKEIAILESKISQAKTRNLKIQEDLDRVRNQAYDDAGK